MFDRGDLPATRSFGGGGPQDSHSHPQSFLFCSRGIYSRRSKGGRRNPFQCLRLLRSVTEKKRKKEGPPSRALLMTWESFLGGKEEEIRRIHHHCRLGVSKTYSAWRFSNTAKKLEIPPMSRGRGEEKRSMSRSDPRCDVKELRCR